MGPKCRHGALSSSGLSLSPGLPVGDWAEGRGWVHSYFQVFPALGQPGSLTNQLLQAQGLGEGRGRRQPAQPQAVAVVEGGCHGAPPEAASLTAAVPLGGAGLAPALHEPR